MKDEKTYVSMEDLSQAAPSLPPMGLDDIPPIPVAKLAEGLWCVFHEPIPAPDPVSAAAKALGLA